MITALASQKYATHYKTQTNVEEHTRHHTQKTHFVHSTQWRVTSPPGAQYTTFALTMVICALEQDLCYCPAQTGQHAG